jgi:hypothetical protein
MRSVAAVAVNAFVKSSIFYALLLLCCYSRPCFHLPTEYFCIYDIYLFICSYMILYCVFCAYNRMIAINSMRCLYP